MRDMELCRTMPGGVSPGTASAPAGSATALAAVVNLRRTRPRRMGPELRAGGRGERGGRGFRDRARRRGGRMRSRADASYPRRACARGKGSRTRRRLGRPRRPRPGRAAPRERGPRGRRGGTRARARGSRDERRSPRRFEARDRRTTRARARRARCSSGGSCTSTWSTTTRVSAGTPTAGGPSSGAAGAAPTPLTRCARQRVRDERGSRVSSLQMRDDTHRRTAAAPPDARIEMS